ncbi:copper amine oxidase N-terminal domain-containing protein [Paenibacillus contaminans]|uniref:Copper amine oxidase-like N-terminal domain-containing protein n=1 Tax=Paenibacillus contaminans TaxID=450362 RepID=A0A329M219_9BACL|nr:copper amine oxidase N-terminal domain-containing protein [Paenibacillus contaminans]RAV13798.1 hypothetical protein DQG23_32455 [Paenibacillus contaminans]
MKNVRNRTRTWLVIMLAVMMSLTGITASAQQIPKETEVYFVPLQFVFDGKTFAPPTDQKGFIYEGSTYVPLRFVAYALNKDVQWEQSSYTVTVQEPDKLAQIVIKEYNMNREVRDPESKKVDTSEIKASIIDVYQEKVTYVFDEAEKEPSEELPGFIYQDTLYVPLRFFSEALNRVIDWDQETYTVSTSTKKEPKPETKPDKKPDKKPEEGKETSTSKPSAASLIEAARSQLSSMESSATDSFMSLAISYLSSSDPNVRAGIKTQAESMLAQLDSQVASITSNLEAQLSANGYDTSAVAAIRQEYADKKAAGRAALEQMR